MTGKADLIGKRFERLTIVSEHTEKDNSGKVLWVARCDCGNIVKVRSGELTAKVATKSCGCLRAEKAAVTGALKKTHGLSSTPEYKVHSSMIRRCHDPEVRNYDDYGGRGIQVCDRWRNSVESFVEDMGKRPSNAHSIERVDNDGNYEPGNCRWATRSEQNSNTRRTTLYDFQGEKLTCNEIARRCNIPITTLRHRLNNGWSVEQATVR